MDCRTDGTTDFILSQSGRHYDRAANKLLFRISAPVTGNLDIGVVSGNTFTMEADLTLSSFNSQYSNIKLIAGINESGNPMCLKIGSGYFALIGQTSSGDAYVQATYVPNFNFAEHLGEEVHLKLDVTEDTWTLDIGGVTVWEITADTIKSYQDKQGMAEEDQYTGSILNLQETSVFQVQTYNTSHTISDLWILTPTGAEGGTGEEWQGEYLPGDKTCYMEPGSYVYIWNAYDQEWIARPVDEWSHAHIGIYTGFVKIPVSVWQGMELKEINYLGVYVLRGSVRVTRIWYDTAS